ncbi:DUF445 domain-containing protein [Brevibacillus daliensis]|uniref:DUF445 domain-containing protein n=1 Tax=Brevibacillus daliensis TaxID=2892995 RepID=UPI001E2E075D|nr:DUF445 family protein [Brevibacillus daliensis]
MSAWLTLLINVGVGSAIGGITNELAIRMLFRPYREIKIGGFALPFTPGLIPRRHQQISFEMGRLVEDHLLTKESVKEAIQSLDAEKKLVEWLATQVHTWKSSDATLKEVVGRHTTEVFDEEGGLHPRIRQPLYQLYDKQVAQLLQGIESRPFHLLLPPVLLDKLDDAIDTLGDLLINRVREYILSEDGQMYMQRMVRSMMTKGSNKLGGFFSMFLSDERLISKVTPYLESMLTNQEMIHKVKRTLHKEAERQLERPTGDFILLLGTEGRKELQELLFRNGEKAGLALLDRPISLVVSHFEERIVTMWGPRLARLVTKKLEDNVERLFDSIQIKEIVTKQVEGFPLERLEEMIIGISGKEFRMITILGFVLGGIIGLVQGLINFIL